MDRLKDNKGGLIALAAGTIAIGYLIYSSVSKGQAVEDDQTEIDRNECQASEEQEIQNFFFLDGSLDAEEQEKVITQWVKDQVDALLHENADSKLAVKDQMISATDFQRVMHIIFCRQSVNIHKLRNEQNSARDKLIKDKGIKVTEYIQLLIEDCNLLIDLESSVYDEVLALLNIHEDVLINSQEMHLGEVIGESVKYVSNFQEFYQYHPYKTTCDKKTKEEALQLVSQIMQAAVQRFGEGDTGKDAIKDEQKYMYLFNAVCIDIARNQHQLTEADFLNLLSEHDLTQDPSIQSLYQDLSEKALAVFGDQTVIDEEAEKHEAELAKQASIAFAMERQETIKKFLDEKKKATAAAAEPEKVEATAPATAPATVTATAKPEAANTEEKKVEEEKVEEKKVEEKKVEETKVEDKKVEEKKVEEEKVEEKKVEEKKVEETKVEDKKVEDKKVEDKKVEEKKVVEKKVEEEKVEEKKVEDEKKVEETKTQKLELPVAQSQSSSAITETVDTARGSSDSTPSPSIGVTDKPTKVEL